MAAVTAAAGYINFTDAVIIGLAAGIISNLVANWRAGRSKIDDTLDVFACHGIGGIIGAVSSAYLQLPQLNPALGDYSTVTLINLASKPWQWWSLQPSRLSAPTCSCDW